MTELFDELDQPEAEAPTPEPEVAAATPEPEAKLETEAVAATTEGEPPSAAPTTTAPPPAREPERTVPLATLLEERRRFEARLRELEAKQGRPEQAKTTPEPEIDYTQDPKGYVDNQVKKALHELEQLKKEGTQQLTQTGEQVAEIRLINAISAAETQIASEVPDYQQALEHVRNVRAQQIQLINPDATSEQIVQLLSQEERAMAQAELARGRNPYQLLYQVAKTFGYTPPAAKPAAPVESIAAKSNGATQKLSPDLTLGKTGGSAPDAAQADEGEEDDILNLAFSERFGRKRA